MPKKVYSSYGTPWLPGKIQIAIWVFSGVLCLVLRLVCIVWSITCDQAVKTSTWAHNIWQLFQTFMTSWWLAVVMKFSTLILNVYWVKQHQLQHANILFHCWIMTCYVIGCSLCPHALFSQAWSYLFTHVS